MVKSSSFVLVAAACAAILPVSADARGGRRGDQDQALQATRQGEARSLRAIENSVVPGMKAKGASYIGQEFDGDLNRYRLKFLRGSSVIWVDVDGRSGAILGSTGN